MARILSHSSPKKVDGLERRPWQVAKRENTKSSDMQQRERCDGFLIPPRWETGRGLISGREAA